MPRIAVVDLLFHWPPQGGSCVDAANMTLGLQRLGWEVRLIVPRLDDTRPRGVLDSPPPFPIEALPFRPRRFTSEQVGRRLRDAVDRFRPDVCVVTDGYFLKPDVVLALRGYPTFLRLYEYELLCLTNRIYRFGHTCGHHFQSHPWKCWSCVLWSFLKVPIKWGLGLKVGNVDREFFGARAFLPGYQDRFREALRVVAGVIVYNRRLAGMLAPYTDRPIHVVPAGIDPGLFTPRPAPTADEGLRILMPGRIDDPAKGLGPLVEACSRLWHHRQDFRLLVTRQRGRLPRRPFLEDAGWLRQEDLPGLYHKSHVVVVPSIWEEPFGIVALEAMACARPVIATRVGGLQGIVRDGVTGFLVPPGDPGALADRLAALLDDPARREAMGKAGREVVEREYTWDRIVAEGYAPLFQR